MDYRKLAEELGGRAESQPQEAPPIDYRALAEQLGGVAEEAQPPAQPPTQPLAQPVATGKPASVIPQLPVTPTESTVPEDEGFFGRNYRYAKDALISGFHNLRASTKGTSFAIARGYIQSFEREYGGPGVPLAPPDVKREYEKYIAEAGEYAQDIARSQKEAKERELASPLRPETARLKAAMSDDLMFMESAKEAGAALFSNPVGVIADLGTESLPNMAYMVSTALLARLGLKSPTAAAYAGGTGSAISQFGNEYVDRLQKGESHDEAWKNAAIRSGVIGVFDAVSLKTAGSAAGKIVEALKTGKPTSVAAKEFIKETGKQAGLGGAGEAAGSLAIGEVPNPAAVIAEMAGETVTAPFEAIGTYQRVKGIEKLSKEDKAIADLDKLAADEEAEAATSGLIGEEDLFAEEAAAAIPSEETVPATLEELKKIDKDLKKKLGRAPTFEETEAALNDFEQEKTRRLRVESRGREPAVSVPSGEEAVSGVTGAPERIEPRGLGRVVEPTGVAGARKEPTLSALNRETKTDTFVVNDAINEDTPQEVQLSVRPDGTGNIVYKDRVIDVTAMLQAGFTPERIIAQTLGEDTTGKNVKKKETAPAALKPEDTAVYANISQPTGSSSEGNVTLQNYFKTYYGLPAKSLPKAAGALMPALERAEALLQRYFQAYNQSNLPFLGTGPWNQGKRNANRPPEYVEADRYMPSGDIRRLANAALAIDKKYKTKGNNPERFASEIAQFEQRLNNFEEAINSLPPPLTNEERQAREADYNAKNPTPDYDVVPRERQLQSLVNLLRKGIYTPAKADPAKLQEAVDAGLITQEEVDRLQKQSEGLFTEEPTAPTEEVAGPSVSAMQAEIDALRAAGAEVPTFEAPSTAAAKREAKAKKERSKAIAKLAAELGGTPIDEDGGFRPARDEEEVETIKAKAGVNARRLSKLLGPKLYGEPSELTDGKLKPLGKRLSDSSEEQAGDAGAPERMAGFRGATEGEPDISGRSDLRSENIGEERERTRDAGEATTSELEQRIIELSLKGGDIHPTMVSAISNNDLNGALRIASQRLSGFSAELAKTLLELKLPTNISFNTGRELVRRSIDNVSQAQQERLFRFVQMHYPKVYDKYFKNYDRSESLETVAAGLVELQKPNYKLGPVAAEFDTVSGAYKKYIEGLTAPGAYYPDFDEIALNTDTLSGKSYRVFLHEVVHAATEYVLDAAGKRPQDLTPGQRAAAEELTKMYNYAVEKLGKAPYGMTNIYEFIAEVFTNKRFQELLKGVKYETKKVPFFTRLVRAIFKAVGLDNLAGNAMVEATKIFSAVRTQTPLTRGPRFAAKGGPRGPRIKGPISTPQTWRTSEEVTTSMIDLFNDALRGRRSWEEVLKIIGPSMWSANTGRFRRAVLGVANLRQIDDLTKTKFPQISGAVRIIEQMLAYRGNIMKSAEDIVTDWTKAQAKKPKQGQLLGRLMVEATIRGIDPDRPGTKAMNAALVQAWNQLDPEFKQIYRQVRDFYAKSVNNMVREMKSRIAKSDKTLSEKKAAIREINEKFGPDKLVQPYFPLRRFGKHWFQVGKGNFKEFYEFEDPFSRELAMRNRVAQLRKGNAQQQALADTIRKGDGLSELFTQNITTTQVLKEAEDIIDNVTATTVGDAKKEMKDSLNQLIYILLPQQSMRKMFINRKAIQGASGDMLRVFATSAVHSAYQQSRFKFAEPFLNNLANAVEYVEEFSDRDRAAVYRDYIQEVEQRTSYILSNEDTRLSAKVAGKASELTFFYMLSAPFSAMLNVLGVAQITMPYIGGRYGYAKTNALMIKNMTRYLGTMPRRSLLPLAQGKFMDVSFPSIVEGDKLTGVLKQAADRFIEEGQINISLTNDLMDMGDRPSALYTGRYNMVKKVLSGLFHQSERLGREVSLLTTFELAYDKFSQSPKKDLRGVIERDAQGNPIMNTPEEAFELAIAEAKDIVGLSLGDFTRQMKPRYFVSPLMSVLTKFKQYSVLATYAVIRNFYFLIAAPFRKKEIEEFRQLMIKDKISPPVIEQRIAEAEAQRKELYREGRRRLAGILAVTYLLGGNEASPFYSIGIGTFVKMLANEDDDEFFDWENWLKNYMEEELGGAAGDLFAEMGMNPDTAYKAGRFVGGSLQRGVVSEITGGDLAGRVSLDPMNLWYREGRYSPDTRESLLEEIVANAGPVVGLGVNWVESYRLFQEGQYQRAFEKAAPALISKPVAAARIAEEDARTASGIKIADNFSAWELAMLSIGLQPTRLAQAQKSAIEFKTYEQKIKDRRNTLLNRLWMERDNYDGYVEIMEKIQEFSLKYPNHAITGKNIKESFERRGENQAKAEALGAQADKRSIPDALEMLRYGRD